MSERRTLPTIPRNPMHRPLTVAHLPSFRARKLAPVSIVSLVTLILGLAPSLSAEETATPPAAPAPATAPATTPATPPSSTAPTTPPAPTPTAPATPGAPAVPGTVTAPLVPVTKPKIVAEETMHDVGKVRKGKKAEVEFVIANQGDGPLKIKDAQPSCGCTVASFDKEIAPGATGKVHAAVDTKSFDGPIAKHVTVLSNDPETPRLVLTIKADVQAFLRVAPTFARLLQVKTEPVQTAAMNLWATDGTPLEIRSVETPEKWVVATVRRPTDAERTPDVAGEQWRIEVSLADDAPVGPLNDSIVVHTSHPQEPDVEIPLSGSVRQLLHVQPAEADFGKRVNPKDARKLSLKLHNFGKEPVEIRSSSCDLPFVQVKVSPEESGRRFRVELVLAPDAPKGKFEGTVKIETSSPVMPSLEFPVRGKVD